MITLPIIDIVSLKEIENQSNVLIIDVRSADEFEEGHIPLAVNIPLETIPQSLKDIATDTQIVTACGRGGGRSRKALEIILSQGYNAKWLEGGSLGYLDSL